MRYESTRGGSPTQSFKQILLEGLAPDGGLYVPETYPILKNLDALRRLSYQELALQVLHPFMSDIPLGTLAAIINRTYTKEIFGTSTITPVERLAHDLFLLKLSNGPTLAFKDVALQLLGNLMEYALDEKGTFLNVLGATSGDTGSAAAYALKGRRGVRLFMLSPYGRMSRFQQMQMYTLNEPNIFNLVVNGTFDDCQSIVKAVNADAAFKQKYQLGAVNSINWARIAAQVVYFVYAYLQIAEWKSEQVTFAVPSGNFGNALSAYIAGKMLEVPIRTIVCTNENDVLDGFFFTGIYRVRKGSEVVATSSPSMDIASASNFERFIFDLVERDPQVVRSLWTRLQQNGEFTLDLEDHSLWPNTLLGMNSGKASDAEVLETIRFAYGEFKKVIDPHTAVAMKVALEIYGRTASPFVVVETALPAKFANTIFKALGFQVTVPDSYQNLADLPEHTTRIDPDPEMVKRFIAAHA